METGQISIFRFEITVIYGCIGTGTFCAKDGAR